MDLFTTGYDPTGWDLVSCRSEGEYLSLIDIESETPLQPESPDYSHSSLNLNFLDLKMMNNIGDLPSLLQ